MKKPGAQQTLFLTLCFLLVALSSCVIPAPADEAVRLDADPLKKYVYLGNVFAPDTDLYVTVLYNSGEFYAVPRARWSDYSMPDTASPVAEGREERRGWVEFGGLTAVFSVLVYDDTNPPDSEGPTLDIPL